MKKLLPLFLIFLFGCTTASVPTYLPDKKPFTKRFYATYDTALAATKQALEDLGWRIEKTSDPSIYEQNRTTDLDENQVLIFTESRQTPLFVGTRYAKMNLYLRSKQGISEVEIRYLSVTSLPMNNFTTYNNGSAAERIFQKIDEILANKE